MKAPFGFGLRFFLRILLPGSILAVALMPVAYLAFSLTGIRAEASIMLVAGALVLGWICSIMDMQIYMIFEGRRFWPKSLREWLRQKEQARLMRLVRKTFEDPDRSVRREAGTDLRMYFPFDAKGTFMAEYPTRLGNLIAAYERYPDRIYGFSSSFLWYPMWLKLDKDRREEIDNQQAMADSSLYVIVCLYIAAVLLLFYSLVKASGVQLEPLAAPAWLCLVSCIAITFVAWIFYRTSLYAHDAFGRTFRAAFDVFLTDVSFPVVEGHVDRMLDGKPIDLAGMRARNKMLMDFMHSSRVSAPGGGPRIWVDQWNDQIAVLSRLSQTDRKADPVHTLPVEGGGHGRGWASANSLQDNAQNVMGGTVACPHCERILLSTPSSPTRVNEPSVKSCPYCSRASLTQYAASSPFGKKGG